MRDLEQDYLDSGTAALPEIGELEIQAAKLAKDNAEISEARLAEGFAKAFAGKLAYAHDAGLWMRFDGAAWRPERRRLAYHFAVEYCRAANTKGDKKLEKAATADAVEKIARARPELAVEMTDFDPDALLIGTPGGIIDLTDGSRRPALASDRISKLTAIAPESGAALRWLTFLHEATGGDADLIRFLRQWCG